MKMALVCAVGIALIVGFGEGFDWVILLFAILVGTAAMVLIVGSMSTRDSNAYGFHNHTGHSDSHVRRHEQGHYNVARSLGAQARIELDNPSGPVTRVWDGHLSPVQRAAICYGGWAKAGSSGIEGDMKLANAILRGQGSGAHREAKRIAKRFA